MNKVTNEGNAISLDEQVRHCITAVNSCTDQDVQDTRLDQSLSALVEENLLTPKELEQVQEQINHIAQKREAG